jgi:hypothetical protein
MGQKHKKSPMIFSPEHGANEFGGWHRDAFTFARSATVPGLLPVLLATI